MSSTKKNYEKKVQIGDATLYLADCMDVLPTLGNIESCITDPPYGIGFPYLGYEDSIKNLKLIIENVMPLIINKCNLSVITCGLSNMFLYPNPEWVAAWTWGTTSTYGRFGYNQWQPILLYGNDLKGFGTINGVLKNDRIQVNGFATKDFKVDSGIHTCPKPYEFVKTLVCRFSNIKDIILDPFMGSGTTGVACVKMGRKFIGIEREPSYFEIACKRIEQAYAQPDLFVEQPKEKPIQHDLQIT